MPRMREPKHSSPSTGRAAAKLLAGANVVVTRPTATATALKRRIAALGGNAISLPGVALTIADATAEINDQLLNAQRSDFVIFVSPAAVRFTFALQSRLRFSRQSVILAVGGATARALKRQGVENVRQPLLHHDSEGLLALPELTGVRGKHVSLIGAPGGRGLLTQVLRRRRAKVQAIHVYHRNAPVYSRRQLAKLELAAAPLITLLSSAEVLLNLRTTLPLQLYARLAAGELVVSSNRLAIIARNHLFSHPHIAASAAPADLLHTACDVLSRHRL
ncbi:MAG TPA: uroporphyrinogen-III synthase [Rudaea sp.]|nr:uroporphyrinogen-III synthase [Rudaea sp.]